MSLPCPRHTHCLICWKQNELEVSCSAWQSLSIPCAMFSACVGLWLMPHATYCFHSCFEEALSSPRVWPRGGRTCWNIYSPVYLTCCRPVGLSPIWERRGRSLKHGGRPCGWMKELCSAVLRWWFFFIWAISTPTHLLSATPCVGHGWHSREWVTAPDLKKLLSLMGKQTSKWIFHMAWEQKHKRRKTSDSCVLSPYSVLTRRNCPVLKISSDMDFWHKFEKVTFSLLVSRCGVLD